MTSRDNLLETLRCGDPQWIPVCPYLFPNENPTQGVPEKLKDPFASVSKNLARSILQLGEYLGAEDYMFPVPKPADLVSDTCSTRRDQIAENKFLTVMETPKGELRQVTQRPPGQPPLVTERYVKTEEDATKLLAYFQSLRVEPNLKGLEEIKEIRQFCGDKGILFCRTVGTPLGMCYRVYADLVNLIYLIADAPATVGELFECMEEKYQHLIACMLAEAPEIDAFFGMDDTSSTLISPSMFERFNVNLTNARADLCHARGKIYMHHSCGLLRNLLPAYRKTRMDGVDAFTAPPIGDVGYAEGRKVLGPGYSMKSGLASGLPSVEKEAVSQHVADRFADARKAGWVAFGVGGASLTFPEMQRLFDEAERMKRA